MENKLLPSVKFSNQNSFFAVSSREQWEFSCLTCVFLLFLQKTEQVTHFHVIVTPAWYVLDLAKTNCDSHIRWNHLISTGKYTANILVYKFLILQQYLKLGFFCHICTCKIYGELLYIS